MESGKFVLIAFYCELESSVENDGIRRSMKEIGRQAVPARDLWSSTEFVRAQKRSVEFSGARLTSVELRGG